jgi:hypothetical protein
MNKKITYRLITIFLIIFTGVGDISGGALDTGKTLSKDTKLTIHIGDHNILKELSIILPQEVEISEGQTYVFRVKEGHKVGVKMIFNQRAILEVHDEQGEYYILQFYQGQPLDAVLAPQDLEFVVGEISPIQKTDEESKNAVPQNLIKLDLVYPLDLKIMLTKDLSALGPFQKSIMEITQPLRTPPQSNFNVELRKRGVDFANLKYLAYAAVRPEGSEGPLYEVRDVEVIQAQKDSAKISLKLPHQFDELDVLENIRWDKWGIPIDLWVLSLDQEGRDSLIAQYRYYLSSRFPSILGAFAIFLIFYAGPLYYLHRQRQPAKRRGALLDMGVFSLQIRPASKLSLGDETDIGPMKARKPVWFSPLWLGRTRIGKARMSSFQVAIWTYLVFFVAVYTFLMNGMLIDINQGMLYLLGISGTGSVLSRFVTAKKNERVEVITSIERDSSKQQRVSPAWTDLIMSAGRVDISRLQILLFTVLTAAYVGITAMETFQFPEVPEGLLMLMGISNGLYVLGKVSEPSLADKLAEMEIERRTADMDRKVKKEQWERAKDLVTNQEKDIENLKAELNQAQGDKRLELEQKKKQMEEELSKLKVKQEMAESAYNFAQKHAEEKEKKYKETLNKLNQELDKESDSNG